MDEYDTQAEKFLVDHEVRFRFTQHADRCPPYCDGTCVHGDHYRIELHRTGQVQADRTRSLHFDYWNSRKDVQDGATTAKPYDVLACISSDAHTADTFEDFCADMGYDEDSRKAESVWKRRYAFSKRLQRFFTEEELTDLSEIQ